MRHISIPLKENNYHFLRVIHPHPLKSSLKDSLALSIESIIKNHSYSIQDYTAKIDRQIYPCEIEISYNENKFRKSGASKLSMTAIKAINYMIDRLIKIKFIEFRQVLKEKDNAIMNIDCIDGFCELYGLSLDDTFFQTLKKFEYRNRKKASIH